MWSYICVYMYVYARPVKEMEFRHFLNFMGSCRKIIDPTKRKIPRYLPYLVILSEFEKCAEP